VEALWVAPQADAARARRITGGSGRVYGFVSFTPEGKIVVESNASGSAGILTMDADGANQRQLPTESAVAPTVSADGSLIAFVSTRATTSHISVIDPASGKVRQLTDGRGEHDPTFSFDGKWVIYVSRETRTLWRVPVEGGTPQQLTDKDSYSPRASPDGKWLAAGHNDVAAGVRAKVAILPFDGGAPVKIFDIPTPPGRQDLHWTPDSLALIYIVTNGGTSNLWRQPIQGGTPKQLTNFETEQIFSFDYSRDGKQLVVSRGTYSRDVVLISNFR